MFLSMNGKAGLVTIAGTSVITKIVTTVPHAIMIIVSPVPVIAGCAMRQFVLVVLVNVIVAMN